MLLLYKIESGRMTGSFERPGGLRKLLQLSLPGHLSLCLEARRLLRPGNWPLHRLHSTASEPLSQTILVVTGQFGQTPSRYGGSATRFKGRQSVDGSSESGSRRHRMRSGGVPNSHRDNRPGKARRSRGTQHTLVPGHSSAVDCWL